MDVCHRQRRWWTGFLAALLVVLTLFPASSPALAQDESDVLIAPRGDAGQTGTMPGQGPATAPDVLWEAPSDGSIIMGMAIVGDTLAFTTKAGSQGTLQALDRASGEVRWRADLGGEATVWGPAVTGELLVVSIWTGDDGSAVAAFDPATGDEVWRVAFDTYPTEPAYASGVIYVAVQGGLDGDSALVALDAESGDEAWRYDAPEALNLGERVAVADGVVVASAWSLEDNGIGAYGFDAESGDVLWTFTESDEMTFDPVAADGVAVLTDLPTGWGVDLKTGEVLWSQRLASAGGGPALVDGVVYYGLENEVRALDAETGTQRWTTEVARIAGAPIVAGDLLYTAIWRPSDERDPHVLTALDTGSGEEVWSLELDAQVNGNQPLALDGVLYVDTDGAVVAYGAPGETQPADPPEDAEGGTHESAEFGYTVTWESPWSLDESRALTGEGQDFITLEAGEASLAIRTTELDIAADDLIEDFIGDREGAFDDLEVTQSGGDAAFASATMTFTQGGIAKVEHVQVTTIETGTVQVIVLEAPASGFKFVFAGVQDAVAIDGEPVFARSGEE